MPYAVLLIPLGAVLLPIVILWILSYVDDGPTPAEYIAGSMRRQGFCACEMCLGAEMRHGAGKPKA